MRKRVDVEILPGGLASGLASTGAFEPVRNMMKSKSRIERALLYAGFSRIIVDSFCVEKTNPNRPF